MSNTYDIVSIVNLLLDMDHSVEDSFLQATGLEKGIQTMVVEKQHHELLAKLGNKTATHYSAGGACTNAVFAAASLGAKTFVNGRVGNDQASQNLIQSLAEGNIAHTPLNQLQTDGVTGKCIVLVTPDAERTMLTHLGISASIPISCIDLQSITQTRYFLVEGFQAIPKQTRETNLKAIKLAHASGAKIAVSLCDEAVVEYFQHEILELITAAPVDIIFCNQFEAMGITKTNTPESAISKMSKYAKRTVMTLGKDGALIFDGTTVISIPGIDASAVDTTGAGDIFVGVFLWGIQNELTHQQAGEFANRAAAKLVTKQRPRLSKVELLDVFAQFQNEELQLVESSRDEALNAVG